MSRLPPSAAVTFDDQGRPVATAFGDFYFAQAGDLAESEAVFLTGAGLPEAWRERSVFTVGEIGFGAGVNILALWAAWRATRAPGAILHAISIEGFPLSRADAARALAGYGAVAPLAERLLARWPVRARGLQRLWFPEDGFALTLVQDDVAALDHMDFAADAWFHDGFAPARNPEVWSTSVFAALHRLSKPGARLATYSVAGAVRRGLARAGFDVARAPGYGRKRQSLRAWRAGATPPPARPACALVVGGGIAGACAARALLHRGLAVTLIEARHSLAQGASGNPAGLVSPRLDLQDTPAQRFLRAAFLSACDTYRQYAPEAFSETGLTQALSDPSRADRLLANPPLPPDLLQRGAPGLAQAPATLHVTIGGVLRPRSAVAALTHGATIVSNRHIAALAPDGGGWRAIDAAGATVWSGDVVVLAGGAASARLAQAGFLPIERRRGQVSWAETDLPLARPITAGAYALRDGGAVMFGATFDPAEPETDFADLAACDEDHARNRAALEALAPDLGAALSQAALSGRVSVRAALRDRLPAAGLLAPGLGVVTGLGARGLTTAPLAGEAVVSDLLGEPSPLDRACRKALDPNRFLPRAFSQD